MEIKEIIGKNIQELRLKSKMTQFELAEKLNYSDKAISKWERGESTPDPEIMLALSKLFNVQIDYFYYKDHNEQYVNNTNRIKVRDLLFTILLCITVLTISTAVYLLGCFLDISNAATYWVAFIYALPIMSIIVWLYFKRIKNKLGSLLSMSFGLWSLLTTVFFQMYMLNMNFWMIYLIGIPFQSALIVYNFMKN